MSPTPSSTPVVLLTGASRGLGLSIARLLLTGGSTTTESYPFPPSHVVTLSRSLTPELKDLSTSSPGKDTQLIAIQGDVRSSADNEKAVKAALDTFGRLDAVILNAGVAEFARIADVDPESFNRQLETNLTSVVTTLHHAIPPLRASPTGCGKVVMVSSGAAVGNTISWGAYNASKAALNSLARTLANEEKRLAVFSVRPGVVDTEMQNQIRGEGAKSMDEEAHKRFTQLHKEGKLLKGEQPGSSIAALALKGTRQDPKDQDGKNIGEEGGFVNWDALKWA